MSDPPALSLRCKSGTLNIPAACGKTYRIVGSDAAACSRLVDEALRSPAAEIVPAFGGLLSGISVLENILLPALYHRRLATPDASGHVYGAFAACGLERAQADALCANSVQDLGALDRRFVALVRGLLMRPAWLLLERLFEGLTASDAQRAARFGAHYRDVVPEGALVYCDLAGIACPDVGADVQSEAA